MGPARLRRPSDAGFSLVEALATLAVVGMIGLMVAQGLGVGRRVWERSDAAASDGEEVAAAQATLRDRIEQLFPETSYDQSPPSVDFDGDAARMEFLASPPPSQRPQPLRRYRLTLGAGGDLTLTSSSDLDPTPPRPALAAQTLLRGVQSLDIAYFGVAPPDGAPRWRPEWQGEPLPPEVVRIRVAFRAGDRRTWPDLLVRPRATIDSQCLLDPVTHACTSRG